MEKKNKLSIAPVSHGHYAVEGELTFASIDKRTLNAFGFIKTGKHITLDLSAVTSTDSAGLALMIEWIKYARHHRTQLVFKNIPEQLRNLARLSGFDKTSHFTNQDG